MIVSASAARTAPAAKARGSESVSGVALASGPAPMTTAKTSSTAQIVQIPRMKALERPCARIEALPTNASGKLAAKMAARSAMFTATFSKRNAKHQVLGDSVKGGCSQQCQTGGAANRCRGGSGVPRRGIRVELLAAMIIFAVPFRHPVQPHTDQGEDNRSDCQADHRSPNAALLVGVFEHLKGKVR